jgi:uncharacterized membrane protein
MHTIRYCQVLLIDVTNVLCAVPYTFGVTKKFCLLICVGFVCEYFVTKIRFHDEELFATRPTLKLEDHPLSAVRDCLFHVVAATLHIGGRSSIRNLRTRRAVVTGIIEK